MKEPFVLNVGIDLGTSRTVIASDNGFRGYVSSYVGFPKDAVSIKMLGKDVLFGDEALRNRMCLELVRPLEKGVIRYSDNPEENSDGYRRSVETARRLMKHVVGLATEAEPEGPMIIRGVIGAPALANRQNKKALLEIARGVFDNVMVVSEPFSVAYGLNLLNNVLVIDIGAGTIDLCRMHGTIPTDEDQVTTCKAGDYIDALFLDLIRKKHAGANFTVGMIKRFKEENAFVSSQGEQVVIELPVEGKPVSHNVTEELHKACRAIVPDIVEGIKKLVATYDPEFQDELKKNILLAGGGSRIAGMQREVESYMKEALGYGKVTKVEEPLYAGANGALMLCKDMPQEYWDEIS